MIVYIENPQPAGLSNLVRNPEVEQIASEYDPKFLETKNLDEVRAILDHMTNQNLFLKNDRAMVFDPNKMKAVIDHLESSFKENGELYNTELRLLTRQHDLRRTVYYHITGILMN